MFLTLVGYFILQAQVFAAQVPLSLSPDGNHLELSTWRLDEPPAANATGHLVFETVNSLLQHWPNTRYRNGHAIVPGIIPKGTLLYHGSNTSKIPTVPEWTATDPEHSLYFCRGSPDTGCWHLTLATTRPLKVLYFDGTSAGKSRDGTVDTQDIVVWGEVKPDWWLNDKQRIKDLCIWGEPYAIDGYVRMEMDFEVMLCNFTAGVDIVSFYNLASGVVPVSLTPAIIAGSWNNRYPGDTRINLDLTGIVSLYDTTLAPSLISLRAGQQRWDHRVQGISPMDIEVVRSRVSDVLKRLDSDRSGIDWKTLFRVIVNRYSERLDLMAYLLNSTSGDDTHMDRARQVHYQLHEMLIPYIFHTTAPPSASHDSALYWATPVFKACGTAHTSSIALYISSLNPSERLLLRALSETTREICRIITKMWATGVLAGLDPYFPPDVTPDSTHITRLIDTWRQESSDLMEWLDWSVWVRCRPACGPEEMCYLPTWPVDAPRPWRAPTLGEKYNDREIFNSSFRDRVSLKHGRTVPLVGPQNDEWRKPQPKCIGRVEHYSFSLSQKY